MTIPNRVRSQSEPCVTSRFLTMNVACHIDSLSTQKLRLARQSTLQT